jgi:hypothetical protein
LQVAHVPPVTERGEAEVGCRGDEQKHRHCGADAQATCFLQVLAERAGCGLKLQIGGSERQCESIAEQDHRYALYQVEDAHYAVEHSQSRVGLLGRERM